MSDHDAFVLRLLRLLAAHDATGLAFWDEELQFYVNCNDLFWWATSDAESVTEENVDGLERALHEADVYGGELFCARARGMRPQDCAYPRKRDLWPLFDACGPERPRDHSNPGPRPDPWP